MRPSFYVYLHRTLTGRPFYVGKGQGRRAWSRKNRNPSWRKTVRLHGLVVVIVMSGLQEWFAIELEVDQITRLGRENLVNLTDGGEGVSGRKISEETREKLRHRKLGKKFSAEHCAALSRAKRGVPKPPFSDEHKARLRESSAGRAVRCSNGLTFSKIEHAAAWLREIGHFRARGSSICNALKTGGTTYGFSWTDYDKTDKT